MPKGVKGFVKGNTFGGYRENSGRPTKDEQEERLTLLEALEREEQKRAARLAKRYYEMAEEDPATMRHVVDGKRPRNAEQQQPTAVIHQFIQFSNNQNTLQLPAEELSGAVLGSDDSAAQETGSDDLAPEKRQGQNGIEFRSFANVPGKRR
jgi:hypothetical protein